jgi:hypothetical protein
MMLHALYFVAGALLIAVGGTLVAVSLRKRTVYYVSEPHDDA